LEELPGVQCAYSDQQGTLFEDRRLVYGSTMKYTFNEPGNYNFSVQGYPKMQTTITVK